jgi:transposase InsO family protein
MLEIIKRMKEAGSIDYSVSELCEALDVPASSYYYRPVGLSPEDRGVIERIKTISLASGHTYGKRRIRAELQSMNIDIGIRKTKRLMDMAGVMVIVPRKRHYYGDTGQENKYAPNLLRREFNPPQTNTHWVGDITYIHNHQGWSYLAVVMDLNSNEIVGQAMSKSPNAALARKALINAIKKKKPKTKHLLFHSDQGSQYSAKVFRECLDLHNITQSMSRRGNCWDNAVMERFFRSLKSERLNHLSFTNHSAAVQETQKYIDFYNYKRRHSAIGYMTPHQKALEFKNVA